MSNTSHISTPLSSLLAMLKSEGFDISTSTFIDIQKVLANLGDEKLEDFSDLKSIISPLICRNKEEQEHFNTVFHKYETYINEKSNQPFEIAETVIKKNKYRKIILISLAGILLLSAIIYFFFFQPARHSPSINVVTVSKDSLDYLLPNEAVVYRAELTDTVVAKKYFVTFKIGDSVFKNTREVKKIFFQQGTYNLTAWLLNEHNDTLNEFHNDNITVYCEKPPSVNIVKDANETNKASKKNYSLQFTNANGKGNFKYKWYINDSLVSDSSKLVSNYKSDNAFTVKVVVDTKGSLKCTDSLTAFLNERPAYALSVIGTKPLNLIADTNWKKIIIAGFYAVLLPIVLAALILFFKKKKISQKKKASPEPGEPKEYTGPYKIEFKDQSEKISAEKEISQLAEAMRKRHVNDLLFLNVLKTIQSTIRSGGFPFLQFTPKTQPADFLVFIDKQYADGLQVTLFEFVINKLEKEQVNINSYCFYKEPLLLSNEKLNQSMLSVDKVARLYPDTILFIFSDTTEFFETLSVKLKPWVTDKLKPWDHKIILTPVPVNDWDYKENTLVKAGFTVVPADLNAHHIITNEINNLINRQKTQHIIIPSSYSSRFVNFDDWAQLEKYLDGDPMLIEWVSALAVYPYVDWKATVAIGKALEEKSDPQIKLVTYTNLLKLSRIKWMQTGLIPDALRLQMLEHLNNDSEAIARNTMLELLDQVAENITESSMVADEFELNKTVNKFLLHIRNPLQHSLSDEENERMKNYVENEWFDQPLEKYLDRADDTLLKDETSNKSISPAEYFKIEDTITAKKIHRERIIRRSLVAAVLLIGFYLLYNFFKNDSNYKIPQRFADISFNLLKSNALGSFSNAQLAVSANNKTYRGEIISDTSVIVKNLPVDTTQQFTVTLSGDSITNFEKLINLTSGGYVISITPLRTPVPLYIRYNDVASYAAMQQQVESAFADFSVSALQSDFSDSSRIVYYDNSQKTRADSIVQIVKENFGINVKTEFIQEVKEPSAVPILFLNLINNQCSNIAANALPASLNEIWSGGTSNRLINIIPNRKLMYYSTGDKNTYGTYRIEEICLRANGMYRIITNAGNGYQDFLIKNVKPSSFELSVCQNRYKTLQEARSVDESYCDHFNVMNTYYEVDNAKSFVNQQGKLPADQLNKLKRIVNAGIKQMKAPLFKIYIFGNSFASSLLSRSGIQGSVRNIVPANYSIIYAEQQFKGTPFDRNYIQVNIDEDKNDYPLTRNADCNNVYYSIKEALSAFDLNKMVCNLNLANQNLKTVPPEIYKLKNLLTLDLRGNNIPQDEINKIKSAFPKINLQYDPVKQTQEREILLTRINFDAKGYPDTDAQSSLRTIVSYLNNYKNAGIRIVFYYDDDYTRKAADAYSNSLQNYLQQLKYNKAQVKFEFKNSPVQQQQQQQKAPNSYSDATAKYAAIYGTGFPTDFSNQLNKKAKSAY